MAAITPATRVTRHFLRRALSTRAGRSASAGALRSSLGYAAAGAAGALAGWLAHDVDVRNKALVLPPGNRACCDPVELSPEQKALPEALREVVGPQYVAENKFMRGARLGAGTALAFVQPGTIAEAAAVLQECVRADVALLPQGANTGLTGGSVPREGQGPRPTVVMSLRRLDVAASVDDGQRVVCAAGVGISDLGKRLAPLGRESHSVLGSIFLNPTVAAGVAFGSGGTQLQKGPAYTERALYCRVRPDGQVEVVNELGLDGVPDGACVLERRGEGPGYELLTTAAAALRSAALGKGGEPPARSLRTAEGCNRPASDRGYRQRVCKADGEVSRFNADTRGPWYNRCEGKVLILATCHDTHPRPMRRRVLWVSADSLATATELKRRLLAPGSSSILSGGREEAALPASMEYLDTDTCRTIDAAGRILISVIATAGMESSAVASLWALKGAVEALPLPLCDVAVDKALHALNFLAPSPLPKAVRPLLAAYDHHLLIELHDLGRGEDKEVLARIGEFAKEKGCAVELTAAAPTGPAGAGLAPAKPPTPATHALAAYECPTGREALMLNRFRFAAAAAFRTWCVGTGLQGLSLDYALPKRYAEAPDLPEGVHAVRRLRYAHFACNVVHEDIALPPSVDAHAAKKAIKARVEAVGGRLPAEHGHGTEYTAPEDTRCRWMAMDPTNALNPGIGGLSHAPHYAPDRE